MALTSAAGLGADVATVAAEELLGGLGARAGGGVTQ
jgi:hypothetical protein